MNTPRNDTGIKQVVAIVGSLFLLWLIYFGSYLPLKKSETFIITLQSMDNMRSIDDVKMAFNEVFAIPSPIGQGEAIRHFSSVILSTVQRFSAAQAPATEELLRYVESLYAPMMQDGRGMSFGQNLFVLGSMNEVAYVQTRNPKYLATSEKYYSLGHEMAPNRPQFLYGLFDLYRLQGDVDKTTAIANQITTLWPTDTKTQQLLDEFLKKRQLNTGAVKAK